MAPRRRLALPALVLALAATACGSTTPSSPSSSGSTRLSAEAAKTELLSSARSASSTSFTASFLLNEKITASGPDAARLGPVGQPGGTTVSMAMQLQAASGARVLVTMNVGAAGRQIKFVSEEYDGSLYVSTDGGATFKQIQLAGALPHTQGTGSVLQYLEAAGTVTDEGPGNDSGVAVERFHATLDPQKALQSIRSNLSSLGSSQLQAIFSALQLSSGSVDVDIDHNGHPVSEQVAMVAGMDLGAVMPSAAGTTLTMSISGSGTFSNFGSPVTVSPPADVTGTQPLP